MKAGQWVELPYDQKLAEMTADPDFGPPSPDDHRIAKSPFYIMLFMEAMDEAGWRPLTDDKGQETGRYRHQESGREVEMTEAIGIWLESAGKETPPD
jgi:hypothetical protein